MQNNFVMINNEILSLNGIKKISSILKKNGKSYFYIEYFSGEEELIKIPVFDDSIEIEIINTKLENIRKSIIDLIQPNIIKFGIVNE